MKVCENGHFLGARAECKCGGAPQKGHKVSLFLPDDLYDLASANAANLTESISAQIVRMMRRSLYRKSPSAKRRKKKVT